MTHDWLPAHAVQPGDRVQDKADRGPWDVIDTCMWEGRPAKECRRSDGLVVRFPADSDYPLFRRVS